MTRKTPSDDSPPLSSARNIILTSQDQLNPDATVTIGPDEVSSPRALQREIWHPNHDLATHLIRALRQLVGDVPRADRRATLVEAHDVTALREEYHGPEDEHHYASLASYALETDMELWRLLEVTRQLGGSTSVGISSTLDDVSDGPVRLLEAASTPAPILSVDVSNLFDLRANQRKAVLRHLVRFSPGVRVRIIGSRMVLRRLVDAHGCILPASVTESAETRLLDSPDERSRTARRRHHAELILETIGDDHVDLPRLSNVREAPSGSLSYRDLRTDVVIDLDTEDAVRQFARRCEVSHIETTLQEHDDADILDEDAALATRITVDGNRSLRLTPLGEALLALWESRRSDAGADPSSAAWPTENVADHAEVQTPDAGTGDEGASGSVSTPPNSPRSTVYSQDRHDGPDRTGAVGGDQDRETTAERRADEAAAATTGGSDASSTDLPVDTLDLNQHHAAAAAGEGGKIAVCGRSLGQTEDGPVAHYSYDKGRDEVVVSVTASSKTALTMTRVCAALLSPIAMQQVLTTDRLAGGPDRSGLGGLATDNGHVLRKGACFGWLRRVDEDANRFRDRLRSARDELLAMTGGLDASDGSLDEQAAGAVLRKAHGLAGTVARIYDMLGVDVIREVRLPDWALEDAARRKHVLKMMGHATSISARYGVYSAYRTLYEDRERKREDALGAPDVDDADPTGDVVGSWVLSGPTVDDLLDDRGDLAIDEHLDLQEDGENYAPFLLDVPVVDGNRREAVATAVSRVAPFKNLDSTRQSVSLLDGLLGDVFTTAEVLGYLGQEDRLRDLDYHDIRYGISRLDRDAASKQILPNVGGATVSKAVHALTDAVDALPSSELASIAGVSKQSLRDNSEHFDVLEILGLLERTEQGPGKATLWRLRLPFRDERLDTNRPTPGFVAGDMDSTTLSERIDEASYEIVISLLDDFGVDVGVDVSGELAMTAWTGLIDDRSLVPLLEAHPELRPWHELAAALLDSPSGVLDEPLGPVWGVAHADLESVGDVLATVTLGADPSPATTQTDLGAAAAAGD